MKGEADFAPPLVLAAPSGAGKTTIARRLVEEEPDFVFSVSATTRPPRKHERDGRDYWFVTEEEFFRMVRDGEMAEWAEVHGYFYGTPREGLRKAARAGRHVVLDIDVQGARQIREAVPDARLLFILPPSFEVLLQRLRSRGTEGEEAIRLRLRTALFELGHAEFFEFLVVNDDLDRAMEEVKWIARTGIPPEGGCSGSLARAHGLRDEIEHFLDVPPSGGPDPESTGRIGS